MKIETRLILVKETKFDKIRKHLLKMFFKKDYEIINKFQELIEIKRPKNIIIPKEIGKNTIKKEKNKNGI